MNKIKSYILRVSAIVTFIVLMSFFAAFIPAQASVPSHQAPVLQATPAVTVIVPTVVVPNTGDNGTTANQTTGILSSWVFWAVVALVFLVLAISLTGRRSSLPPHHHDDEM